MLVRSATACVKAAAWGGVGVGLGVPEEPVDDSDGDSEFGLDLWVFVEETFDKTAQSGPSGLGVWVCERTGSSSSLKAVEMVPSTV